VSCHTLIYNLYYILAHAVVCWCFLYAGRMYMLGFLRGKGWNSVFSLDHHGFSISVITHKEIIGQCENLPYEDARTGEWSLRRSRQIKPQNRSQIPDTCTRQILESSKREKSARNRIYSRCGINFFSTTTEVVHQSGLVLVEQTRLLYLLRDERVFLGCRRVK